MDCTKKDGTTDIIKRDFTKLLQNAIIEILKNFPKSKKDDFVFQLRFPALATGVFYKEAVKTTFIQVSFYVVHRPQSPVFPSMFGKSPPCFILCVMNPENSISFSLFQMYFLHYRSLFTFV